jgi:hypothetical protein
MSKSISIPLSKTQPDQSPEMIEEQIRQRAYGLYEQRGREDGYELDDWLKAESEVKAKAKATAA